MRHGELAVRGFSCPQEGLDRSLLEFSVVEHARQTMDLFIERFGDQLQGVSNGLSAVLSDWLHRNESFETVWSQPFGEAYAAVTAGTEVDTVRCAADVAMRLHSRGHHGQWCLRLNKVVQLRFDKWLLPPSDAIEMVAEDKTVSITTCAGSRRRRIEFRQVESTWFVNDLDALPTVAGYGARWNLLPAEALPPGSPARALATGSYEFDAVDGKPGPQSMLDTCGGALKLLAEFGSGYLGWVAQVIREIIPLPPSGDMTNSASGNLAPGVITASNQGRRCVLAEMLVHESTHHYLYILKRLGPLEDGSDGALYFSPFRNVGRPILYIIFAYHAFANVLLFYRTLRRQGLSADEPGFYSDQRIHDLEESLRTLEGSLQSTTALTSLGRALCEPLYERIRA